MLMTKDEQAKFEQLKALDEIRVLLTQAMIACEDYISEHRRLLSLKDVDQILDVHDCLVDILRGELDGR